MIQPDKYRLEDGTYRYNTDIVIKADSKEQADKELDRLTRNSELFFAWPDKNLCNYEGLEKIELVGGKVMMRGISKIF